MHIYLLRVTTGRRIIRLTWSAAGAQSRTGPIADPEQGAFSERPGAGFTFSGGATDKVHLAANGADFWVVAWVGHPSKIPGLGATKD